MNRDDPEEVYPPAPSDETDPEVDAVVEAVRSFQEGGQLEEVGPNVPTPVRQAADLVRELGCLLVPSGPAINPSPDDPVKFGKFWIIGKVGQGGFGAVYLAVDSTLDCRRALKLPRPGIPVTAEYRASFLSEARLATRLDHPNIVQVHEAGEVGSMCYLAMTFCDGGTLADWLENRRGTVEPRLAARLVATLARAVQHAHDQGLLHRDLKPRNVLLFDHRSDAGPDELPCTPRICDFGLARLLEAPLRDSASSWWLPIGSPSYMAPEQSLGQLDLIGRPTDVFALGAILYELLVGNPPFQAPTDPETIVRLHSDDPIPPTHLRRNIPRSLEAITLMCLEKTPSSRYGTAQALADDLDSFLAGRRVLARTIPRRMGFSSAIKFMLVAVSLTGSVVLALVAGSNRIRSDRSRAETPFRLTTKDGIASPASRVARAGRKVNVTTHNKYLARVLAPNNRQDAQALSTENIITHDMILTGIPLIIHSLPQKYKSRCSSLMSNDGRFVLFRSEAADLVHNDINNCSDIFIRDALDNSVERISVSQGGGEANAPCSEAAMTPDGRFVVFASRASNLVPGDSNSVSDIFLKDLITGGVVRVSLREDGRESRYSSNDPSISDDGRFVAFYSDGDDLLLQDDSPLSGRFGNVYIKDLTNSKITKIQGFAATHAPSINSSGRFVAFIGSKDFNSMDSTQIYLKDLQSGIVTLVSAAVSGSGFVPANSGSSISNPCVSADGRYVVFTSFASNLVEDDTNRVSDIFLKDIQTGKLTRISTGKDGKSSNGRSYDALITHNATAVLYISEASNIADGNSHSEAKVFICMSPNDSKFNQVKDYVPTEFIPK